MLVPTAFKLPKRDPTACSVFARRDSAAPGLPADPVGIIGTDLSGHLLAKTTGTPAAMQAAGRRLGPTKDGRAGLISPPKSMPLLSSLEAM